MQETIYDVVIRDTQELTGSYMQGNNIYVPAPTAGEFLAVPIVNGVVAEEGKDPMGTIDGAVLTGSTGAIFDLVERKVQPSI